MTSLSLLVMPLMRQPSILLAFFATAAHCSLILSLLSTRTPRFLSTELLPSQEEAMGNCIESLGEIQVDNVHCVPHINQAGYFVIEGDQPVPMPDNPCSEEIFTHIQSKPPLAQLEAISSHPIACYLGEEAHTHLTTTSFQVVVESDKVSPQPPFLQAKQPQFPQPLLIRLVLQTLHQLRCPSLDMLQHLNVSLVGPKLNTVFKGRPHQCRGQGQGDNHFPSPAGHTISETSQDAIGLLGHLGTLLAHIQLAIDQHHQVLFYRPLFPKPVALHGVVVTQVQDLALSLLESHKIGLGPSIQPIQIPLAFLPSSRSTLPHNLVSSANLLRVHSIASSRSLIKILNRTGPSTEPWGTPLVTSCQVDLTPFTTTLWARPSSQFFTQ
ncbi:LOW QUALITY PROTEIN: hypothetical protein QYF61_005017 [Mycteria americana]|uniref:Uncharacterized protein n=1 Tax=Mycteria americana TaxID=33587 RepID=A0AAN7ND50_MYCAM|nr:LOW QUALITY PROTEIN: hypothetical protein QYF61_005017 [Mycteria americana]